MHICCKIIHQKALPGINATKLKQEAYTVVLQFLDTILRSNRNHHMQESTVYFCVLFLSVFVTELRPIKHEEQMFDNPMVCIGGREDTI